MKVQADILQTGNYRSDMAHVMRKLILLNDLSILSLRRGSTRQSERKASQQLSGRQNGLSFALDVAILAGSDPADSFDYSDALSSKSYDAKGFTASAHMEMMDMLEEWEEPELQGGVDDEVRTDLAPSYQGVPNYCSLPPP